MDWDNYAYEEPELDIRRLDDRPWWDGSDDGYDYDLVDSYAGLIDCE